VVRYTYILLEVYPVRGEAPPELGETLLEIATLLSERFAVLYPGIEGVFKTAKKVLNLGPKHFVVRREES
jgi:hypothetical protein